MKPELASIHPVTVLRTLGQAEGMRRHWKAGPRGVRGDPVAGAGGGCIGGVVARSLRTASCTHRHEEVAGNYFPRLKGTPLFRRTHSLDGSGCCSPREAALASRTAKPARDPSGTRFARWILISALFSRGGSRGTAGFSSWLRVTQLVGF